MRRAAHQILDSPRVFEDPLALRIIGPDAAEELTSRSRNPESPTSRYLRGFMAARSRYAEDELACAVNRGVRQYVILGAGLDTLAYRNPYAQLHVFEVDHLATQEWKRRLLEAAGISVPTSVTFVAVNFEKQTFSEVLCRAGFNSEAAGFFAWLGVTPYLPPEIVLSTLRAIIALGSGNSVVFDCAVPRLSLNGRHRAAFDALANRVASAGEPFRGFFEPEKLASELKCIGFSEVEDLGGEEVNARYFSGRADGLHVSGALAHLVCARGRVPLSVFNAAEP
jgi:methyltransferase (TIGR00027 family)